MSPCRHLVVDCLRFEQDVVGLEVSVRVEGGEFDRTGWALELGASVSLERACLVCGVRYDRGALLRRLREAIRVRHRLPAVRIEVEGA